MKRLIDLTEPEIKHYLRDLGAATESVMPLDKNGKDVCRFVLLIFDDMDGGIGQYVSNAQRPGMIKTLRETADRLERKQDLPR